jgi:hypothetical protein
MGCFKHHCYAACGQLGFDQVSDHFRHPLLDLGATRDFFDNTREFTQADDFPVGQVSDVGLASKRQKVVFAHAAKIDVAYEYHFIVFFGKDLLQVNTWIGFQTREHFGVHPRHACWGFKQSLTIRVFAHSREDLAYSAFDAR